MEDPGYAAGVYICAEDEFWKGFAARSGQTLWQEQIGSGSIAFSPFLPRSTAPPCHEAALATHTFPLRCWAYL